MTARPGDRFGPYEVLAAIGAGGMGKVYRARDTTLGRTVALKILRSDVAHDPDGIVRFRGEAQGARGAEPFVERRASQGECLSGVGRVN